MITLKRTTAADPDFIALVRHLDAELAIRDGEDHDFYNQFNRIDSIRHVVVAYDDEAAVGCGAFKHFDDRTAEIKRMYVPQGQRGKGVASRVLTELERWAAAEGYARCILETGIRQPEAIALYTKNGYARIPNFGQYEGVENSVCFQKSIVM